MPKRICAQSDDVIEKFDRTYTVTYDSGRIDTIIVNLEARLEAYMEQNGRAWKFPDHMADTRRVYFKVKSYIKRHAFYLLGNGQTLPYPPLNIIYPAEFADTLEPSDIEAVLGIGHHTCGDVMPTFEEKKKVAKNTALKKLKELADSNFEQVVSELNASFGSAIIKIEK